MAHRCCARDLSFKAGLIKENPLQSLSQLTVRSNQIRRQRRALSDDEIELFLRAAEKDDRDGDDRFAARLTIAHGTKGQEWAKRARNPRVRQAPLMRAFLETAARYGELTRTTWADLDIERREITLRGENTKNGKARTIPLRETLVDVLLELQPIHERVRDREVRQSDRIFLTPRGED